MKNNITFVAPNGYKTIMQGILVEVIGYAAAFFGTILMLPQTYKSYKTKKADDISMLMLVVYIINCVLWGVYGWMIVSYPIIVCNSLALLIGITQIFVKLKYKSRSAL